MWFVITQDRIGAPFSLAPISASLALQKPTTTNIMIEFITTQWLRELGGHESRTPQGFAFWDFPIVIDDSQDTFLRVHEPDGDRWPTDLFSMSDGNSFGIANWPRTKCELQSLMRILGCRPMGEKAEGIPQTDWCESLLLPSNGL